MQKPAGALGQNGEDRWLWGFLGLAALLGALFFALLVLLRWAAADAVRSGGAPWPVEAWAGSLALAYLLLAGLAAARCRNRLDSLLPLGCVLFVGLVWLAFIRQCYGVTWDFRCYFEAGRAIRHGVNIYDASALGGHQYLYSPVLATIFSVVEWLPLERGEEIAYWFWNIGNYWAVMVTLLLLVAALRRYRVSGQFLWPAAAAALVCNVPLQRTLIYSQLNLHVLNLILGFLLLYRKRPVLAGGLLAAAALLKSSPLLLLLPVIVERRWRALLGFVIGAALLKGASIAIVGTRPWVDFSQSLSSAYSHGLYRDNSLQSLIINLARIGGFAANNRLLLGLSLLLTAAAVIGLIWLAFQPKYRTLFAGANEANLVEGALPLLLAAMVIASPRVWEHHWVFLLFPFCLLIARVREPGLRVAALLCYGLVFVVPTFDIFPLSYHRLAGLIWWVILVGRLARAETATNR